MKIENVEKFVNNLHDKTEYVIHTRNSKEALTQKLIFEKVHRVASFNQDAGLKPYIYMNTKLRQKAKNSS